MKRFCSLIICIILILSVAGCGIADKKNDSTITIVTTVFPIYDFAKTVAGDKAEVVLLLPAGAEAHSYEPTVQDVVKIQECDLFIHLGKGADPWTESIIADKGSNGKVIAAMECVELKKEQHIHEGHNEYEYDQHIWTSLRNSKKIVVNISSVLKEIDKENAEYYEKNAEDYAVQLDKLDKEFSLLTEKIDKTVVFADRFPFRYFAEDYGIECFAAYPGCSAESEPSAATVAELIDTVKKENITTVYYTETSNGQLPDAVCEETGAKKLLFHSCHTVTKKQFENGASYLDLMKQNYKALEKLL